MKLKTGPNLINCLQHERKKEREEKRPKTQSEILQSNNHTLRVVYSKLIICTETIQKCWEKIVYFDLLNGIHTSIEVLLDFIVMYEL